ncbi:hypothetical protein MAM1_0403c10349 [Mucor ambiguus]|uniref:C2H2-type domain-containing protein n=1 Tax=Mucor ambiguus TaxID=91626 RepID=A0A0C9MTP5_9FUNG|nr:hypothetical protein MAM1_0392d10275 [Mucor ambiguus]GAN10799.1 hypothetical protein MAM1_0403c10349 [Mucor ambiguus]
MTFTNELFVMDDFVMADSPAISPHPRLQLLPAANSAGLDDISGTITLDNSFGLASSLFPVIDSQFSNITINDTTTDEQFSIPNIWQEGSFFETSSTVPDFEQNLPLESGAATIEIQPISMTNTPDLSSVYTSSYSPSLHMLSSLDYGHPICLNVLLFLQEYQEEPLPLSYEAQQQDMVSPVSRFDLIHSPANSHSIMEEQSVYSATPPIQSPNSITGHDDGRLYSTAMAMNSSRSANTLGKPRYDCPECDQTFGRSQESKRHHQSCHSDIKSFRCDCCDKAFSRKDALKRHKRSKKSDRQKRRFQRQGQSLNANKKGLP